MAWSRLSGYFSNNEQPTMPTPARLLLAATLDAVDLWFGILAGLVSGLSSIAAGGALSGLVGPAPVAPAGRRLQRWRMVAAGSPGAAGA